MWLFRGATSSKGQGENAPDRSGLADLGVRPVFQNAYIDNGMVERAFHNHRRLS